MDPIIILESVTVALTLYMQFTGIPPCYRMYKTGSTKNVPFFMFLFNLVAQVGMLHYNIILQRPSICFINIVALILQTLYVITYLLITKQKLKYMVASSIGVFYLWCLYYYIHINLLDQQKTSEILGSTSSTIVTFMMILPAFELYGNIKNQNADGVPFIMLVGGLACSTSWLLYGLILNDFNVYIPNVPGITVGL